MSYQKRFYFKVPPEENPLFQSLIRIVPLIFAEFICILELVDILNQDPFDSKRFILFSTIVVGIPAFLFFFNNTKQTFEINNSGIKFWIFHFWTKTILWNDIEDIFMPVLSDGGTYVIFSSKLPISHYLIGMLYTFTFKKAFVFDSSIKGFDEAVNIIQSCVFEGEFSLPEEYEY